MLGKILEIEEVIGIKLGNIGEMKGSNGSQLGFVQMLNALCGYGVYDGYKIKTEKHEFYILIENGQCCCEDWGYFFLNDDEKEIFMKYFF